MLLSFPYWNGNFWILVFFFEILLYNEENKSLRALSELVEDYIFSIFISFIYFYSIFYSVMRKNYLSKQNIYGIRKSGNLYLLNSTETISGLIVIVYKIYIVIRIIIVLLAFFLTLAVNKIEIKICC